MEMFCVSSQKKNLSNFLIKKNFYPENRQKFSFDDPYI